MNKDRNNVLVAIIMILVALTLATFLKFFSPEDVWLCDNGQWVRHGNPSASMPTEICE